MKYVCSLITVSDMKKSREFYETVLGQKVAADYGENTVFESGFAIHLRPHFRELIDGRKTCVRGNNFELYFEESEIDAFALRLEKSGVELVHGLKEQPWRQKVIRFYDPDGNLIEVGEPMEELARRLSAEKNV